MKTLTKIVFILLLITTFGCKERPKKVWTPVTGEVIKKEMVPGWIENRVENQYNGAFFEDYKYQIHHEPIYNIWVKTKDGKVIYNRVSPSNYKKVKIGDETEVSL